ncbi:MAG: threonylcarbamoyl-AMP synthase [Gemmatimonadaceae bacterium]|nr:threonylcarbamoyl-AMP synthase [Gemmatimonadaceae bacterium]MCW5825198.1 threonylcarbamoyl-AMP synthase [Gemmatimonadaceae bacterium]
MPEPRGLPFWSAEEIDSAIAPALAHLRDGGILAYPTETLYGFGTMIDNDAVERLVTLKRRPPAKPFLLLISDTPMLARIGLHLTQPASMLAARHWPGPLTLVLPGGERRIPDRLRGPEGGVAVRWTPHPGLQRLIAALGDPITSTSANRPGEPAATAAREVLRDFGSAIASGSVMLLDAGQLPTDTPSTVVDCTGKRPRVIRPGAIPASVLRESVPDLVGDR